MDDRFVSVAKDLEGPQVRDLAGGAPQFNPKSMKSRTLLLGSAQRADSSSLMNVATSPLTISIADARAVLALG